MALFFQPAIFQHKLGSVKFPEYVVPTLSYRMGTNNIGAAIAVLGKIKALDALFVVCLVLGNRHNLVESDWLTRHPLPSF